MRSRRLIAAACGVLVIATSCSGHHTKVLGATKSKAPHKAVPHSRTAPTAPPGVPKVILQSGTAYQNGALVQFCAGSSCRQGTGKPARALATPDPLRGRVTALHILAVTSGPRIGDIEAAAVAAVVGAQASVVSGGILCLLGAAAVTRLFPELGAHVVQSPTAVVDGAGNEEPA